MSAPSVPRCYLYADRWTKAALATPMLSSQGPPPRPTRWALAPGCIPARAPPLLPVAAGSVPLGHTSRRPQMGLIPPRSHPHERRVDGGGAPHGSICAKLCVLQGTSAAAAAHSLGKGTYPNLNVEVRAAHLLRASKFMQVVPRQTHLHELPAGCVLFPGVPGALPDSSVGESCINRLKAQSSRDSEVHQMLR